MKNCFKDWSQSNKLGMYYMSALLYNFTSVCTNILSCRRDKSKTSFPLQEGIFVYSYTWPRSAVGNVSSYRCESDCRSRGREFDRDPGRLIVK